MGYNLNCDVKTHPTVGPLFGSYEAQLDIFQAPIRLYNAFLHNNKLGVGMNMSQIKLPQVNLVAKPIPDDVATTDIDNCQINPSAIMSYLGIRGVGYLQPDAEEPIQRKFNAVAHLS